MRFEKKVIRFEKIVEIPQYKYVNLHDMVRIILT